MFNLIKKVSLLILLGVSIPTYSTEEAVKQTYSKTQHSQSCPSSFYSLPLIAKPEFCQQFSTDLPASLSYHTKSDQASAKRFYLEKIGQAESENTLKGRIVLQYNKGQKIVIISPDGQGSQIDILVKATN